MVQVRLLIVLFILFHAPDVFAAPPGHLYLTMRGGLSAPGIASEGSVFKGRSFACTATYFPVPEAKLGLQVSAGLEFNAYRHFFDDRLFIEHLNRGISSDICARLSVGDRIHVLVGLGVFLPVYREVDMGEKNYNHTVYYSNDSLRSRYSSTSLQASALIAFDYSLGKKGRTHLGLRVAQAVNSPVEKDANYNDGTGNTVVISREMRAVTAQFYLSLRIAPREKRKDKLLQTE